jgi:hypothetical protein
MGLSSYSEATREPLCSVDNAIVVLRSLLTRLKARKIRRYSARSEDNALRSINTGSELSAPLMLCTDLRAFREKLTFATSPSILTNLVYFLVQAAL